MAELFAAVAAERTGIASEPPVDIDERTAIFVAGMAGAAGTFVAVAGDSSALGSWSVTIPVTVASAGNVSMGFDFTNQLTLIDTGRRSSTWY